MEIYEILKKLAICNHYIKHVPLSLSKNNFYKLKTFFIYNLLKQEELLKKLKISVFKEVRENDKFYSFHINLGDEIIKLHQCQSDIPDILISNLLASDLIFDFSEKEPQVDEFDLDSLNQFIEDIIYFSKDFVPENQYLIIYNEGKEKCYDLYKNGTFLSSYRTYGAALTVIYQKNLKNDYNLTIAFEKTFFIRLCGIVHRSK